ncbi:hypothetical protein O181_047861 [Austropuccinia psidii MF-1]|uniref:Uncharacterized protein n=1 Tax=Austropuccinia psidii MF-1 TaxID=1389203 RepID=A0A9Q3DWW1_9BASI|nr:hypothetical protein [Austropuccinia psidii MF-1]
MPCKQTPQKPTSGPSGTQWSEDLFCGKEKAIPLLISSFHPSEMAPSSFLEPSQHNEQPIPGPSQSSKSQVLSHEDALTCEPAPEVAAMQSTEEHLSWPATPCSVIIINNMSVGSPHSHNEAQQEFTDLQPTLMIPQAIFHKSINQILLEH